MADNARVTRYTAYVPDFPTYYRYTTGDCEPFNKEAAATTWKGKDETDTFLHLPILGVPNYRGWFSTEFGC